MTSDSLRTAAQMVGNFMGVSMKNRFTLRRSYDIFTCKEIIANKRRDSLIRSQKLRVAEHAELGSDIAVAKFVLGLRGRVQCGDSKWITNLGRIPKVFDDSFKLTTIVLTDSILVTEGVDNFVGLEHLESLNLSGNFLLDDFACDQLSRQFRHSLTLRNIDLSQVSFITTYGLEALLRISSLRNIRAIGTTASKYEDIDLFALAAQEECGCKVIVHDNGRQFRSQELEDAYNGMTLQIEGRKQGQIDG